MRVVRTSVLVLAGLMVASASGRADPVPIDLQHRHPSGLVLDIPAEIVAASGQG
ncbi:hypothetical protein [Marinivivus vitaminiproducens]|uniref:hypothetical protein n=1 Tax=Marinivivus vitaminiproducens TaxID=3035935 RepID=UPI00279D9630|nr:hypothetical protein P4R82_24785 [Geminicoccaceae bacterium SCSIO 64248]